MADAHLPHSLDEWTELLSTFNLPVDAGVKTAALEKLNSPSGNARNVAQIIKADPALALILISTANRQLSASGNEVTSLEHAISLMGFPQTESALLAAETISPDEPFIDQYRQELTISWHAATQAAHWAKHNGHWDSEILFWASLFQRAPIWAMWLTSGQRMHELNLARARRNGASHFQLEDKFLGARLADIAAKACEHWALPSFCQQSWQADEIGQAKQWLMLSRVNPEKSLVSMTGFQPIHRISIKPAFAIVLANRLAIEAEWHWHSQRTTRLEKVLATCLGMSHDKTAALIHKLAIDASSSCPITGTLLPACQLLSLYDKSSDLLDLTAQQPNDDMAFSVINNPASKPFIDQEQAQEQTPLTASSDKDTLLPKPSNKKTAGLKPKKIQWLINEFKTKPGNFKSTDVILNITTKAMCEDLGLERCVVCLYNRENNSLRSFYHFGTEASPALQTLRFTIPQDHLLNKLMFQPAGLWMRASNYAKVWPKLPEPLKKASGAHAFFMMSLFKSKQPIALIYADCAISDQPMSEQQYDLFKQLCNSVNFAISSLSKSRKSHQKSPASTST